MLAIGVDGGLVPLELFVTVSLSVETVSYQAARPSASLSAIPISDFVSAASQKPTVHSEGRTMFSQHLKRSGIIPKDQRTFRSKFKRLSGIR